VCKDTEAEACNPQVILITRSLAEVIHCAIQQLYKFWLVVFLKRKREGQIHRANARRGLAWGWVPRLMPTAGPASYQAIGVGIYP
jgi:hypothetical protein